MTATYNQRSDISDTLETCIERYGEGSRMRGCLRCIDYVQGNISKPNYQVPAVQMCQWCGSTGDVCHYNGDGYWCPSLCFQLN